MKIIVMTPTYNERDNIGDLVRGVHKALPSAHVLVVDDSSPDGTAEEVKRLMRKDKRLNLLLRPREIKGRGWAGRDGFVAALRLGADAVVEMDADLSHDPKYIPELLKPIKDKSADVVLGSRFVPGGKDADRPWHRQLISRFAHLYISTVLGLKSKDLSSGYRVFTKRALETIRVSTLKARDPFIVSEVLYRCQQAGLRIVEVPIVFVDRTRGTSKLGFTTLLKYLAKALVLRFSY